MYYTSHLRKYDMGVLQLGFFTFPIHFIPPGAESFMSYGLCKTEKFEEVRLGGWEVPRHRSGLIHSTHSLHPARGQWLQPGAEENH